MAKKIAVAYWTSTGNTQELAENIEKGAREAGAETWIDFIDELDPDSVKDYDVICFGCPAMGDEALDGMFHNYFNQLKDVLKGKDCVLFGTWGWGNGAYMKDWEQECRDAGIHLIHESLLCRKKPDEAAVNAAIQLGKEIAAE